MQDLKIRLDVIDNASKAFTEVKNNVFNLRNALIGLGAGVVINSIINIGKEAEQVSSRLNQLAKSGYGGSQAFDQLTKFAIDARIPLLEVFQAAGDLLSVSKSPQELAKRLEQAANSAAFFRISFTDASDQIAKGLLKGADSARLFQDKGIRSLDGFGQFADKSFEGFNRALDRTFSASGTLGQANKTLKSGLTGTLISLDNIIKQFQITVSQSFFQTLNSELGDLELFILNNKKAIDDIAISLGQGLSKAVIIAGNVFKILAENISAIIFAFELFIALKIAAVFYDIAKGVEVLAVALNVLTASSGLGLLIKLVSIIAGIATSYFLLNKEAKDTSFLDTVEELSKAYGLLQPTTIKDILDSVVTANSKVVNFLNVGTNIAQKNLDKIKDLKGGFTDLDRISATIVESLDKGIKSVSDGLARSIILGESLSNTFRKFAQDILVNALSTIIELIIRTYILKSIFEALGLPVEQANNSARDLKNTTLELFGINSANYGLQLLTTSELQKQNEILKARASIPQIPSGMPFGNSGGGGFDLGTLFNIGASLFGFAEGGSVKGGVPITVGERGRELFIPSSNGTVVSNQDMGNMGSNINFTINTVDVRGVEDLLINNRATITNIVNQALNSRGKSNLI